MGTSQGPIAPVPSKFLPWVTLNLACRTQSDRAFVAERQRAMRQRIALGDVAAGLADDRCTISASAVKLGRASGGRISGAVVADEGARKAR